MKPRQKRLTLIIAGLALLGGAAALVLSAFQQNLVFFHTPSEVAEGKAPTGRTFRIGGMVETGSIHRLADGVTVSFVVTDTAKSIPVRFSGPLPDLFKEGKGAVVQGKLDPEHVPVAGGRSAVLELPERYRLSPKGQAALKGLPGIAWLEERRDLRN
jgi:cytochrome c-type biogenesis protein CcmE